MAVETGEIAKSFWRGKRVLVTGHTGFKGGWLTLWLRHMDATVIGLALPAPTDPSLFESADVAEGIESRIGDIRDVALVCRVFEEEQPEIVFHLAAQPLVRRSYLDPVQTYTTNVIGLMNILEAVRRTRSVRVVVVVTSDKCYENNGGFISYRESDHLGGHDPYSSSKACAEIVASSYRRSFLDATGVALATARAGNVIGGGDWAPDRLIPDFVRAALRRQSLELRSPSAVRPWQHVLEALGGYLVLAERLWVAPGFTGSYNFGPDAANIASVLNVVREFARNWPDPVSMDVAPDSGKLHESAFLALDSTRARLRLGWHPVFMLEEAIAWTAAWYCDFRNKADLRAATLTQIEEYRSRTNVLAAPRAIVQAAS